MNAKQQRDEARVKAIVSQIAYAQAHGARAVLAEAVRDGSPFLTPEVVGLLESALAVAVDLENLTGSIGAAVARKTVA